MSSRAPRSAYGVPLCFLAILRAKFGPTRLSSTRTEFDREFDYIVVGAGTAGCVLAARLSEDARNRVCLIEAGGSNRHPFIAIPAAVGCAIMSPKFGWGLSTVPQPALNGRKVPLPRGRVIGGTGSINRSEEHTSE